MKITNWRRTVGVSLIAAGLWAPSQAQAVDIPLGDPSFEAYVVPQSGPAAHYAYSDLYRPTSAWIDNLDLEGQDDGDGNWIYDATYAEGATLRGAPRTGVQAMHGRFGYNMQKVSNVFEAGKTYTFSIYAQGHSLTTVEFDEARSFLYLFNGSQPFAEETSLTFKKFSTNTGDYPIRPVGSSAALSKALWQKVSISHTVYSDSPELGQPIGVGFYGGADVTFDDAALSADVTILTLEVNTTSGATRIVNQTGQPVSLDYYQITSAADSLNKAAWNSLQTQNLAGFPAGNGTGNGWEKAGAADDGAIGESFLTGNSQLAAAGTLNLGAAFSVGDPQDLNFQYAQATNSRTADFNGNGVVDGSDFLAWQRGNGTVGAGATKASGNANTDQLVNAADLAIWKSEFGNSAIPKTPGQLVRGNVRYVTSFAVAAVPEPSSIALVGLGVAGFALKRRR
ncbi:PEP-CTERM sorting domain-containing protein [Lacipirellula sp.]|uniref:PEP-CTERM sorting domain-containing protein n=1 Tax=Lacipirellula sp. TaxID=2691419 RepID=UPI003D13BC22